MDATIIISIIGIIAALALMIFLVMRGVNILLIALLCSAIVALTGQIGLYDALKNSYMEGFVYFFKNYFLIFFTGTLMGKMMEVTNGAKAIAKLIVRFIGADKALIAIPLACGVLAYGGVSVFVVSFAVFPIALEVFKEADLPRRFIPAALTFGCSTFAMVAPGAPQIHNVVPTQTFGTDLMAGAGVGFVSCAFMLVLGSVMLYRMVAKEKKNGAHFVAKEMDIFHDEGKMPNGFLALLPLVLSIALINIKVGDKPLVPIEVGVFLGALAAFLLLNRYQDNKKIVANIGEACKSSIFSISNTCAVVAFGFVVKAAVAFPYIVDGMLNVPGPALLGAALGTTVIAGITGSASGGLGIAVPILGPAFLAKGLAPAVLHRTMTIASASLDSLPHNGYIVTVTNGVCNETHKDAYMPIFWLTVFTPFLGTILAIVLFSIFPG